MSNALGKAAVEHADFKGTVALDCPDPDVRLYELAGLSFREWLIVAFELAGSYGRTHAYVWAIPRDKAIYAQWEQQAREGERHVAATRFTFQVEDDEAALTLLRLNRNWSIHALYRSIGTLDLDLDLERDDG